MKFGPEPVEDAEGAILAHGVPAAGLAKGIILGAGHLAALQAQGIRHITVARLDARDVGEDAAADQLARALVTDESGQGMRLTPAASGRVNIIATRSGLLDLDVARITALNSGDPMITCATLPHLSRVVAGTMLATIKIISYGVSAVSLAAACAAIAPKAEGGQAMSILSAQLKTATLIETQHAGGKIAPKGRRVLEDRLDRLGADLIEVLDVPHEETAIAEALKAAKGEVVFLLTASATSDINDTAPAAVRHVGGEITQFGLPVDPGNLLFLAKWGGKPIIGLPGCARSPALNGADWVLERVICGIPVRPDDMARMGVGGLLKDIPERGRPRTAR